MKILNYLITVINIIKYKGDVIKKNLCLKMFCNELKIGNLSNNWEGNELWSCNREHLLAKTYTSTTNYFIQDKACSTAVETKNILLQ